MNEASAKSGIQQEGRKSESSSIEGEGFRMKVSTLRDGVRQILFKHEIPLGPGVSNAALLAILSQIMGNHGMTVAYVEDLSLDWRDEYRRIVEQIAVMLSDSELGVRTEPQDIVTSIKQRLAA